MPAIFDDGDIDVDNVALFQDFVIRDAVTNLVVDRGANRLRVWFVAIRGIVQRRGNGQLHLGDVVMRQLVQGVGGHPSLHMGCQEIQYF